MKTRSMWFVISLLLVLELAVQASAQSAVSSRSDCQLRVATGKKGRGFSRLFHDIQSLCGQQIPVCEVESEGGLLNTVLLSANEADLAFVQIDTLLELKHSDENIAALQAVLPINANLLHIIALRAGYTMSGERSLTSLFMRDDKTLVVSKLSQLKGLPVAVVGSAQLLGRKLDGAYNLGLRFVDAASDEQAVAALKSGEVAAVLTMSGWPNAALDGLARDAGIVLATFDLPAQAPYQLVHKNYPKLGVFNQTFLAAPNLLVTRPFKADGMRGRQVATLQRCIVSQLDALREGAFEPGWKELKSATETYGWPRFAPGAER